MTATDLNTVRATIETRLRDEFRTNEIKEGTDEKKF